MSEWLIRCKDDLKSGAYYVGVDIHDGEQPVMILFRKDGEKISVVGQGEPVNPHGDLIDRKELYFNMFVGPDGKVFPNRDIDNFPHEMRFEDIKRFIRKAPVIIPSSE